MIINKRVFKETASKRGQRTGEIQESKEQRNIPEYKFCQSNAMQPFLFSIKLQCSPSQLLRFITLSYHAHPKAIIKKRVGRNLTNVELLE